MDNFPYRHFGNLIEPAIRHGEQSEIGCPKSVIH